MNKQSQLDEFRNMVDNCDDKESLDAAYQLLSELLEINSLKYKLEKLESGLTNGKKAMFYFFAAGLTEDEIVFATERVKGKTNRLLEKEKKKEEEKKQKELQVNSAEITSESDISNEIEDIS